MKALKILSTLALGGLLLSGSAYAVETHIMVRAKANDAKFIGSSVGGVRAIITDAETGQILDQGWINGGTGNTDKLIKEPIKRGETLTDDKTAGFLAKIDIDTPRLVKIKVIGPYGYRQALQQASVTTWVVPGKDISSDGIILNLPGFIVDAWTRVLKGGKVDIYTKTAMICGCPIKHDGYWDPDNYEATAILMQDGKHIGQVPLKFTGPIGLFSGSTTIKAPGHYKAIVYLYDKKTGNVGVDRTVFEINKP